MISHEFQDSGASRIAWAKPRFGLLGSSFGGHGSESPVPCANDAYRSGTIALATSTIVLSKASISTNPINIAANMIHAETTSRLTVKLFGRFFLRAIENSIQ
jgi:hypothetical protein